MKIIRLNDKLGFGLIIFAVIIFGLAGAAQAATRTVTKIADTDDGACDADCSLREAINTAAAGDTIVFASPLFDTAQNIDINGELLINKSLTVTGKGANLLTVRNVAPGSRVFTIVAFDAPVKTIIISGMTVTGGNLPGDSGGGVLMNGSNLTTTFSGVHVTGNTAGSGGGINIIGGTFNLNNSTVSNNTADGIFTGGGVVVSSGVAVTVNINNSTVSGNRATNTTSTNGGGIYYSSDGGTMTITNSTITDNEAANGSSAGGVYQYRGTVRVRNTIIAANRNNTTVPDAANSQIGPFVSNGYNLIGNAGSTFVFTNTGDQTGTGANPRSPGLFPLALNGGATPTHALRPGSPAVDKGDDNSTVATTDQRGLPRPVDLAEVTNTADGSDIGAFELQTFTYLVSKTADTNGTCSSGVNCSLREAIAAAPANRQIGFDPTVFNTPQTITLSDAAGFQELVINKNLTITGSGANLLTIQRAAGAAANFRIFNITDAGVTANLEKLTVTGGNATGTTGGGGILVQNGASAALTEAVVTGNAAGKGGGIRVISSALTVTRSTVSNNTANGFSTGGGIDVVSISGNTSLTMTNSTVSGNTASGSIVGGGIFFDAPTFRPEGKYSNEARDFSSLAPSAFTSLITASTITDNFVTANGSQTVGGIQNNGATVTIRNTIVAANRNNSTSPDTGIINGNGAFSSDGYNLIGNPGNVAFTQTGDQAGTNAAPINPFLSPLAVNGGATPTHALQPQSPAIDSGNAFGLTTDQTGRTRPIDLVNYVNTADGSDIGAYELQAAPTAAAVTFSGRVLTPNGRGLQNALVILTDQRGERRTVFTSAFGYYRFTEVAAGETFIAAVSSKRYRFAPQVVTVNEEIANLDFIAAP